VPSWDRWGERTALENFNLRQNLLDGEIYDGYLLYVDGKPAAWCQLGQRDRLAKLVQQLELELDSEIWAITCFLVVPSFRHQGLATYLLKEVLRDLM
jgi:GNAT superfamily N-acetyltransferase